MTLQRVKAYSTLKVAVGGNFPDDLKSKKLDFTKTASFSLSGSTLYH